MPEPEQTTSVVFRGGTVLPMDDAHTVLTDADVLVVGDKVAAVGPHLDAPPDALEVDARGGIVMPGMPPGAARTPSAATTWAGSSPAPRPT
jgi:5-methylthioadenosine/S-adenosylhomocysteine deaminase